MAREESGAGFSDTGQGDMPGSGYEYTQQISEAVQPLSYERSKLSLCIAGPEPLNSGLHLNQRTTNLDMVGRPVLSLLVSKMNVCLISRRAGFLMLP